jgi:hypothetical protein
MSVVQKNYFYVQNRIKKPKPEPDPSAPPHPDIIADITPDSQMSSSGSSEDANPIISPSFVAKAKLPFWFTNAPQKYKKIIRVLGATVSHITNIDVPGYLETLAPGYRIFSNIVTNSNVVMMTATGELENPKKEWGTEGFVMMVNNYNCTKEYDVTYDNLREVKFYLRPWNGWVADTPTPTYIDFMCELELQLLDSE